MNPIVVIPARMASARLPGKPLAEIAGAPMIVHVVRAAEAAGVGPVVVAVGEAVIAEAVEAAGGRAVLTDPDLPSGSDRVRAAADLVDPDRAHDVVVNLQGDMPTLDPEALRAVVDALADAPEAALATLVTPTEDPDEAADPNCVKAIVSLKDGAASGRALYFTRATAPSGPGPVWHHIGIYAFRRPALDRFTALEPSPLERRERLEQLRALEDGMTIAAAVTEHAPLGVDTPADLEKVRALMAGA